MNWINCIARTIASRSAAIFHRVVHLLF